MAIAPAGGGQKKGATVRLPRRRVYSGSNRGVPMRGQVVNDYGVR